MRVLSDQFMHDLEQQGGLLNLIAHRLRDDTTLDLQIRDNYVNIYYRGGSLMKLSLMHGIYTAKFDSKYRKDISLHLPKLPKILKTRRDADCWVDAFQDLKHLMDVYFSKGRGAEREAQQFIVRDNNRGKIGAATDFFICDIEYARKGVRFDMVGVHWPSTGADRKQQQKHRLVLIELKYGDRAIKGGASLGKHVKDIDAFLGNSKSITMFMREMKSVFNQKHQLGLINCSKFLESFSEERPLIMLIFANHDPDSTILHTEVHSLPCPNKADICIATSNFMGYGLFGPAILSPTEFRALGRKRV